MSDENMSAEEAAELVGPWHPEVDGRAACLLLPRLTSTVVNLHAKLDAERAGFDAFADLQRVKLESARAEIARLRRLALVPMAPGEVPTGEEDAGGWYVIRPIDDDGTTGALECAECWWDADGDMFYSGPDCGTCDPKDEPAVWLARIPVEALGEVACVAVRIQEMLTDEEEQGDANA